ncbi:MAG: glycosyltransferase family 9 protein, partial [Geopsychrobacter sp.]|nr:glycosyltransferase family 9 protein [Geopsychrobacter sp.]
MHYLKVIDRLVGASLSRLMLRPAQMKIPSLPMNRLLLIRPGGIGDAVLLIPVIRYLKQIYPTSSIEILAEKRNCGVFVLCPGIDRVLVYDRPQELGRVLFERYDLVIDSEQWHYLSAIIARMIRSRIKIGFGTNGRRRLFSHAVAYRHDRYEQASFFELLKPLDLELPAEDFAPFLTVPLGGQHVADDILKTFHDK